MARALPQPSDWESFDELRALQDKRLPDVLRQAAQSPFYRERFGEGATTGAVEFADIGLTTKEDLANSYPFGLLSVPQEQLAAYFESSGSGGRITPAFYTEDDFQDLIDRYARKTVRIRPSDVFLVRSPYALGLAANLTHLVARHFGATVVPGDNRSSVIPYPRVVRVLHDLGVTIAWANPTDTLLWAATARRAGLDPATDFPALRALYVGGEPLSPARRARISRIWGGIPVLDEYGCTEIGSLAGYCSEDRLHFWADRIKPELYDTETGELRSEGEGELVLTSLYLDGMPLVRYNIHDRARITYADCPCGLKLPLIEVLGRTVQGYAVTGVPITQFQVENVVFSLPEELGVLFWRARAEPDLLHLQVEADPAHAAQAKSLLEQAVMDALGVPASVEVLSPGGLVPDSVIVNPRQSLKPRGLYGPGENWEQAIVFPES
jgi:phenylacetate-CoA ligase